MSRLHWIVGTTLAWTLCAATALSSAAQVPSQPPAGTTPSGITESFLRESSFVIPFQVDPGVKNPVEVQLYVSRDRGSTWELADRQRPAAGRFSFRAADEGSYWFSSRTISGQQARDVKPTLKPELLIHVDTRQPQLDFQVRQDGPGRVAASWSAYDPLLDSNSFRIEYRSGPSDPWKAVDTGNSTDRAMRAQVQGQVQWTPAEIQGLVDIRAEVRDRSGNLTAISRRLRLPRPSRPVTQSSQTNQPSAGQASARQSQPVPRGVTADPYLAQRPNHSTTSNPWAPNNIAPNNIAPNNRPPNSAPNNTAPNNVAASPGVPRPAPTGPAPRSPFGNPSASTPSRNTSVRPTSPEPFTSPRAAEFNRTPARQIAQELGPANPQIESVIPAEELPLPPRTQRGPVDDGEMRAVTSASDTASRVPDQIPLPRNSTSYLPAGERPTFSSGRSFELDYDVEAAGHQGVAEAQLWVTLDGGRRWVLWGKDEDLQSPIEITVREDGIFGFRMVIVGRNGLATPEPLAGEPADIWVGVDTAPPITRLTGAQYGRGHQAGKLIIRWDARDAHLSGTPITLLFSDSPNGPWSMIAADLPNTGEYLWHPEATLPREIFVRIEARDQANNIGHAQLDRGISIDGLAPRARIRGFKVKNGK